jgi:two-component system cell cycle sensor histidine kinase/response regulator CckA
MTETDFTGQGTILLAEDEEGLRALFARGLRSRGYSVIEAANGLEALKVLEQPKVFDLLVSDVVMPEMDGLTLLKAVRDRRPDLAVLFISGYAFEQPEGAAFLSKPFSLAQLVVAVKEAMAAPGQGPQSPATRDLRSMGMGFSELLNATR